MDPLAPKHEAARPPLALRLGLAAARAAAPSLAARALELLFLTPPRRPAPPSHRRALAAGEPFAVALGRQRIRAWRFGAGPAVLLVHGWGGRAGQLASLVEPLVSAGCSAVAFDAPAHGASDGRLASGITFARAIGLVAEHVGARAAIGHSLGGTAIAWEVAHGLALDAAVLLGAPRGAAAFFRRFCDALALDEAVREAVRSRISRRYGLAPEAFDVAEPTGAAATPLLVVQDRSDREVPWADADAIARAWRGAIVVATEGLGHRGLLRNAAVVARAAAFVADNVRRCACGRGAAGRGAEPWCDGCALGRELYERERRIFDGLSGPR